MTISSSQFGRTPTNDIYGGEPEKSSLSYLQNFCADFSINKCLCIPIPVLLICFIIVAFGQFIIPTNESFRFIYWIVNLILPILFLIFGFIYCNLRCKWFTLAMALLMLACSILGLLRSLNVISCSWIWIFSPLLVLLMTLLIIFCYMNCTVDSENECVPPPPDDYLY